MKEDFTELAIVNWVFYALGAMNEILAIYQECDTFNDSLKFLRNLGLGEVMILGSYLVPVIPLMLKPYPWLSVSDWILLVSATELILSVRTLVEGKVLRPCRLIVGTIGNAASHLFSVGSITILMGYVLLMDIGCAQAAQISSHNHDEHGCAALS